MIDPILALRRVFGPSRQRLGKGEIGALLAERRGGDANVYRDGQFLKIFETSRQTTWLIATPYGLDCVIDALSDDRPRFLWHIPPQKIVRNKGIVLSIVVTPDSETTGFVVIDEKKPRKFSLSLFSSTSIKSEIEAMLFRVFVSGMEPAIPAAATAGSTEYGAHAF